MLIAFPCHVSVIVPVRLSVLDGREMINEMLIDAVVVTYK